MHVKFLDGLNFKTESKPIFSFPPTPNISTLKAIYRLT